MKNQKHNATLTQAALLQTRALRDAIDEWHGDFVKDGNETMIDIFGILSQAMHAAEIHPETGEITVRISRTSISRGELLAALDEHERDEAFTEVFGEFVQRIHDAPCDDKRRTPLTLKWTPTPAEFAASAIERNPAAEGEAAARRDNAETERRREELETTAMDASYGIRELMEVLGETNEALAKGEALQAIGAFSNAETLMADVQALMRVLARRARR